MRHYHLEGKIMITKKKGEQRFIESFSLRIFTLGKMKIIFLWKFCKVKVPTYYLFFIIMFCDSIGIKLQPAKLSGTLM